MTKRFYKHAAAAPADGGFAVELDGRAVKTPAGNPLVLPTQDLAQAIAREWDTQGEEVDPKSMKLMPLAGTAIDRVPEVRDGLIEGLLKYAETDLLCHRASHPQDLAQRQFETWQPLLDWAADELGARLTATEGILAVEQDATAVAAFAEVLTAQDNWVLTALGELVGITGSLVVGLALLKGHIDVDAAFNAMHVDEDHQRELWGDDAEALARREHVRADLDAAYAFMTLSRKGRA